MRSVLLVRMHARTDERQDGWMDGWVHLDGSICQDDLSLACSLYIVEFKDGVFGSAQHTGQDMTWHVVFGT